MSSLLTKGYCVAEVKVRFDEYILYVFSDFCHNFLVSWAYLLYFIDRNLQTQKSEWFFVD